MEPLQIFTFGGLRVLLGKAPVPGFETRKADALLVYLAYNRRGYPREVLADLLWDERTQQQALANLRVVLARLRKPLEPYLDITRETISLNSEAPIWIDVAEFELCLSSGRTAGGANEVLSEEQASSIERAVELYQGEFLRGFYLRESRRFEAWVSQERERLYGSVINALHALVGYSLQTGTYPQGIVYATRLLALDPFGDLAQQQMMRLLAHCGRRNQALARYENYRRSLWEEFGVEPAVETKALVEKIRSGELVVPPPSEAALAPNGNFPIANPYKGLRAFQEADADDFFGREALTGRLVSRLGEAGETARFLALVGPSGSGKSSLVKAGLIPALRRGALPCSAKCPIVQMVPGSHPFEELEIGLLRIATNPAIGLMEQLRRDERGLLRAARLALPSDESELLLVIDQFEEVFTLVENKAEARQFLESLTAAVTEPRSPVRVVITLRADFFDRPLLNQDFSRLVRDRTEVVVPLAADELERAIRAPAERVGVEVEPALVAAIVADMVEQPGALPLLQYALTELFDRSSGRRLTLEGYQTIGGVQGVLDRRAEETFAGLSEPGKAAARQVFLRLVTLSEGPSAGGLPAPDTRRRALRSELETLENIPLAPMPSKGERPGARGVGQLAAVLDAFGKARLLSFDRDVATRSPTVEIAHEALLSEWRRLREWLDESRADVHMQRALGSAAAEWMKAGRDPSFLLHGARLRQLEGWIAETDLALTGEERAFVDASLAEREAQRIAEEARKMHEATLERRARLVLRLLLVVLLLATLGSLALAWAARKQANLAHSRELALNAMNQLGSDPERSMLLALQALRTTYTREAEEALHQAIRSSRVRMALTGHTKGARGVEFSPDGKTIITSSFGGEVTIWEAGSGQKLFSLPGRIGRSSPDGVRLATGSEDGTVTLWELATRQSLLELKGHTGRIFDVHFSPDGRLLVSSSADNTLIVWDTQTGQKIFSADAPVFTGEMTNNVLFSPDGRLLLSLDHMEAGDKLRFWGVDQDWALVNQQTSSSLIALSPDGRWLASISGGESLATDILLWDLSKIKLESLDLRAVKPLVIPAAHNSIITNFAFSRDGMLLASVSMDSTAKVWRLSPEGPEVLMVLSGHTKELMDVAFSPDRDRLATASEDGTVRIWDITSSSAVEWFTLTGHTEDIYRLSLTSDGKYLATASADGTAKIWELGSEKELLSINGHGGPLFGLSINPDGTLLATAGDDNTAKIWRLDLSSEGARAELLHTLRGHANAPPVGGLFRGLTAAVFSPDGAKLATGGVDGMAKIWEVKTGVELLSVQAHPDHNGITRLVFSPDGRRLLTATDEPEALAKIWDVSSGKLISTFSGHSQSGRIWGAAFSPDGARLATGSRPGSVKIWEADSGKELAQLAGHTSTVIGAAFSPDGRYLVTASVNGTARVWDTSNWEMLREYTSSSGAFLDVAFTPDGKDIIASGAGYLFGFVFDLDETIQLANSRLTRWFTPEECRQYLHQEECPPR